MEFNNMYTAINASVWDKWSAEICEWTTPISHETFIKAKAGEWGILLTPVKTVPKEWFPSLSGTKVLGLAAGGGQQMPILAAQGAICTVMDISWVQGDMTRWLLTVKVIPLKLLIVI